jgi:hypothetical protein
MDKVSEAGRWRVQGGWRDAAAVVVVMLVAGGAALALDGGGGGSGNDAASSTTAGTTDTHPARWEKIVPAGDCHCADGSEFAFWERRADPTKVVFFMDGGGELLSMPPAAPSPAPTARARTTSTTGASRAKTRPRSGGSSTQLGPTTRSPTTR